MSDAILDMLYAVAAQAFQFLWHAERFYSGPVTCRYSPHVRHGEIMQVTMPDGFELGPVLTAYIEGYEHVIEVAEDGTVKRRTHITFSRGLFDEDER